MTQALDTTFPKSETSKKSLLLTPRLHASIDHFLKTQSATVHQLIKALGSPLNILFPQLVRDNVESFQTVLKKHGLRGRVYFAHKTNMSDSLTRQLACERAFLDVSSLNELRHGLASGFTGDRIEATGPKTSEFLALGLQHGITFSIDSLWELRQVISLRKHLQLDKSTKILIRLSGFHA